TSKLVIVRACNKTCTFFSTAKRPTNRTVGCECAGICSPSRNSYFATSIPLETGTTYFRFAFCFIIWADIVDGVVMTYAFGIRRPRSSHDRRDTKFLTNGGP